MLCPDCHDSDSLCMACNGQGHVCDVCENPAPRDHALCAECRGGFAESLDPEDAHAQD